MAFTYYTKTDQATGISQLWYGDRFSSDHLLVTIDINPANSTGITSLITIGARAYFTINSSDFNFGNELWVWDGGPARMVKDINPGSNSSNPGNLVDVNGTLFFTANDGVHGYELWKTDGTSAGTVLVKDIKAGSANGVSTLDYAKNFVNVNGTLFFTANDGVNGEELWKSDGTSAGTVMVKNINPGGDAFSPGAHDLVNFNGLLVFVANDGSGVQNLWVSDGTTNGTVKAGPFSGDVHDLTKVGGLLYSYDSQTLWASTTGLVLSRGTSFQALGGQPYSITDVDGTAYFGVGNNGKFDVELWRSNGFGVAPTLVKAISTGNTGGLSISSLTAYNGKLYFVEPVTGAIWVSDGTTAGTQPLYSAALGFGPAYTNAQSLKVVDGRLEFIGGTSQFTTYATLGTGATTVSLGNGPGQPFGRSEDVGTLTARVDLDNSGTSDILLQDASGSIVNWNLNLAGDISSGGVLFGGFAGWKVVGTGDFNADGTADVVLQKASTGQIAEYAMHNGSAGGAGSGLLTSNLFGWNVVGTGDFKHDGTSDILLQDAAYNVVQWQVSNGAVVSGAVVNNGSIAGWKVVGTGDFNADGTTDILLQNGGSFVEWTMHDGVVGSGNVIATGANGWKVVGTGDFNGDGYSDILLQDAAYNVVDWQLGSNGVITGGGLINNGSIAGWTVVSTGDFNGDSTTDILLNNGGGYVRWAMHNGAAGAGSGIIATGADGWTVVS